MSDSLRNRIRKTVRAVTSTACVFDTDTRGVTEAFAYALLLGLSIVGIAAITFHGGAIIEAHQAEVDVEHAERAFLELDDRADEVALGESSRQEIDLGVQGDRNVLRTDDAGWMRIEFINTQNGSSTVVANVSLGRIEFGRGETKLAYQGGGVWRSDDGDSVMVSPPPIRFENGTLSTSVVTVEGSGSVYDSVAVTQAGEDWQAFPNESISQTNKLRSTKLVVTVNSDYYEGWADFFRSETDALVYEDDAAETAQMKFLAAPRYVGLRNGLTATAGTGQLLLKGTGAYTDSYNSSIGPYATSQSGNGTVWAAGDVELTGDSMVNGSIRGGGIVELGKSSKVGGDVYWTDEYDSNSATVTGSVQQIDGVAAIEPIDRYVRLRVDEIRSENDNGNTSVVSDGTIEVGQDSTKELAAGTYYVEHIHVKGGTLVVNTTNGDVTLAVRDYVHLERKGSPPELEVIGDGNVTVFVAAKGEVEVSPTGLGNREVNLHVPKGGSVTVPDQQSHQLRIYSTAGFKATVAGSNSNKAHFEGAIYAPGGRVGDGYTYVKQAEVYGGIISSNLTLGQYGAVHYDESLQDVPFPRSPTVSRIDFLYVTVHPVEAEAAEPA